ncbi:DNA topoisomerase IB [Polaromonas sp. YR568]|uniref:DNA topoisomerase IB n=1 Tax=Polaromonas sp. YR568 TaxID=1855301 RepID=UPI00398BBE04
MLSGPTPSSSETISSRVSARSAKPSTAKADAAPDLKGTGLVYVSDDAPGFTRIKSGGGFRYRDVSGKPVKDPEEIRRINKLAIPPAYTRVWICPRPNGHLQATGYDARGRKQYRYHADWQALRGDSKFERLQAFGEALPRLRARVARDLAPQRNKPVSRSLVLATLVRLLDTTFVRVGNDEYARENGSYGLTTLRNPHAGVRGKTLQLRFRGKSGVMQDLKVDDPKVAAVVRRCQQLPGQLLFQYEDEAGELRAVGSGDVNDYLAEITAPPTRSRHASTQVPHQTGAAELALPGRRRSGPLGGQDATRSEQPWGQHFTAKDFRTWHGTVQALELTRLACNSNGAGDAASANSYSAKAVLQEVARLLGNTPAVCKKSYIHPAVLELGGHLAQDAQAMATLWPQLESGKKMRRLYAAEHRLLALLESRRRALKAGKKSAKKPRGKD